MTDMDDGINNPHSCRLNNNNNNYAIQLIILCLSVRLMQRTCHSLANAKHTKDSILDVKEISWTHTSIP